MARDIGDGYKEIPLTERHADEVRCSKQADLSLSSPGGSLPVLTEAVGSLHVLTDAVARFIPLAISTTCLSCMSCLKVRTTAVKPVTLIRAGGIGRKQRQGESGNCGNRSEQCDQGQARTSSAAFSAYCAQGNPPPVHETPAGKPSHLQFQKELSSNNHAASP